MRKKWFIGVDISKKTLDVVIYDSKKKHSDSANYLKVSNDEEGFNRMVSWFQGKRMSLSGMVIGMESTGIYGFDLRVFLESKGIDHCVYMPLALKRSLGLTRGKNDKLDAERIAYYTWLHREELSCSKLSGSAVLRLQELSNERKTLVKQQAVYKAYLTEMDGRERTASCVRAEEMLAFLKAQTEAVEKEMEEVISRDSSLSRNYRLLLSIKGIGSVNAIHTIIHTNNFEAFETARQFACYLGIAPFGHTSGTTVKGKPKVLRMGPKQLKADLSQAANSAIVWDKELKAYYERKRKEGKAYGVVLNAVKFKLVCRMFAVVKRGTPFVELMNYKS